MNTEKINQILAATPEEIDAGLKKAFAEIDKDNKGYITLESLKEAMIAQGKMLGLPQREPTEEEKNAGLKILDPKGEGKVTFENYRTFSLLAIKTFKEKGGKV